jgi:hypothetical protein
MMTVSIHAKCVEGELVLAQHPKFLRARDRTFGRFEVARKNLHQRRFSGAVWTRNGITPARKERTGDVFKQNSGTEAHGDVLNGKQGYLYDSVRGPGAVAWRKSVSWGSTSESVLRSGSLVEKAELQ